MMTLKKLLRKNIANLKPYSCARDEFKGVASVYLDANESPYNGPLNRYPDPLQMKVKEELASLKNLNTDQIFLGNGSDEAIDLLYRAFCEPKIDNVVAIDPSYGMYKVCANINDVEYRKVNLNKNFDFKAYDMLQAADKHTKLIWLCSPNNPTGNSLNSREIERLLRIFEGLVVVDEAYIDFSTQESLTALLKLYPNLVVLQTFSKAWGSAAIRLGMAYASPEIIAVLNKIKYPYNINILTQEQALKALQNRTQTEEWIKLILAEREVLNTELQKIDYIRKIYPTDANFILIKVDDANRLYQYLVEQSIIVRNRTTVSLCEGCIRITVGTPEENRILIENMLSFQYELQ